MPRAPTLTDAQIEAILRFPAGCTTDHIARQVGVSFDQARHVREGSSRRALRLAWRLGIEAGGAKRLCFTGNGQAVAREPREVAARARNPLYP